ncbi:MAG TPA: glycosyltransferase [Nevskiaceae bacterium]|nr:glycosyltransferase [Nevskiaceae bacterium]
MSASRAALLDLSRLLSCSRRAAPSGIDRVELAYAQRFLPRDDTIACALSPLKRICAIDLDLARRYVNALAALWQGDAASKATAARLGDRIRVTLSLSTESALHRRVREAGDGVPYLLVSHHHLDRPEVIERLVSGSGAQPVFLVHDLIPMTHPEYGRPGQAEIHARRIATIASQARGIILNSAATQRELAPHLDHVVPTVIAPLGLDLPHADAKDAAGPPYFIYISTIEPRKNHLLLLNLWRQLAQAHGAATPRLIIVGRRGWENENAIDMIERCVAIQSLVEEHNMLPDAALAPLLAGARALLLPSFVEGYGLPVAEALAAGVPVICSDLPALREVGGEVPEYLDPLDGVAWRAAVLDYADRDSPRRASQLGRLPGWRKPEWSAHFAAVEQLLQEVSANVHRN